MLTEQLSSRETKALTNEDLLSIVFSQGTRGRSAHYLASKVTAYLAKVPKIPTVEDLMTIDGIDRQRANQVLACLELSARYLVGQETTVISCPEDILPRLSWLKYEAQEHMVVITLDSANHVIGVHELTTGLANQTPVHPREAFVKAVEDRAVSVMFAHNHPSGNTEPSPEDIAITKVLCAAGKILSIPVIDHIIISKGGFRSLCRSNTKIFEESL